MDTRVKYPRTPHLPWSEGATSDDRMLDDVSCFAGREVVVTEKMDGENTSMYPDYIHARSLDGRDHPTRSWVKGLWSTIAHEIPEGFRVCGENLYAQHSLGYEALPSYFLAFSVWEGDRCLSWDETVEWTTLLGLHTVPVLYRGPWDEAVLRRLYTPAMRERVEGYVVRIADSFSYDLFSSSVAKFVRANHVTSDEHWMNKPWTANGLRPRSV